MKLKQMLFLLVLLCAFPLSINAQTGYISVANLANVRDVNNKNLIIDQIYYGTKVDILSEEGDYYKVNYGGRAPGLISKSIVKLIPEYNINQEYCESLKAIGFDESYCPYLSALHEKHPNWTFTAQRINHDFDYIINGEDGQNLVQIVTNISENNNPNHIDINYFLDKYITSTQPSEGSNWYPSTKSFNAYFLDPRNFLSENTIFMFEDLGCDESSYWYNNKEKAKATICNIFTSDSYLVKDVEKNYIEKFYNAGVSNKVSPILLAARVKQEGGWRENYGPITGTVTDTYLGYSVYGYYNYYNVGASSSSSNPQMAGLLYACGPSCGKGSSFGRPWTTRDAAIYGGAQFISGEYISVGQSTKYLQKFDVVGNSLFIHQYMSNITAPLTEGFSSYNSYIRNNIVSNGSNISYNDEISLNFSIPVYNNMGSVRELPTVLDGLNYLTDIKVNGSSIANFDPDITNYTKYVLDTTTKATITFDKSNSAVVNGKLEYDLIDNETNVSLEVVALNGSKRIYNVKIVKVKDTKTGDEIINNIGVRVNNGVISSIKINTAISTIVNTISSVSPLAIVTVYDQEGNVVNNTDLKTGYRVNIQTAIGDNKDYYVAVLGDPSGDGNIDILDLLKLQKYILGDSNLESYQITACDTNNDNVIDIVDLLRVKKHILQDLDLGK